MFSEKLHTSDLQSFITICQNVLPYSKHQLGCSNTVAWSVSSCLNKDHPWGLRTRTVHLDPLKICHCMIRPFSDGKILRPFLKLVQQNTFPWSHPTGSTVLLCSMRTPFTGKEKKGKERATLNWRNILGRQIRSFH